MDGTVFINELKYNGEADPNENVLNTIWKQYERVVLHSLITSFGLDFLVHDQHGGDVDTIHNVRQIGNDPKMKYKNANNEKAYENRGDYDTAYYHSDLSFSYYKKKARVLYDNKGTVIDDAYVPGNTLIPRNRSTISREHQGQLDHVISAREIHEDRGRILAGMDGRELANNHGNFRWTNADLNRNKADMSVEEYFEWAEKNPTKVNQGGRKGVPLTQEVKEALLKEDKAVRNEYNKKLAEKYYFSPQFRNDAAKAAVTRGAEMALRQALGLVLVEVWMSAKEEIQLIGSGSSLEEMLEAVGNGIKKGLTNATKKYKELMTKIAEGFGSGALASLTTTVSNIFFTTAKNIVKYIRQAYAAIVQAGTVLLFNPDNLVYGERIRTTTVILASGASVIAGTAVGEMLSKTPLGSAPEIGQAVTSFGSCMVSGLLSCTFLIFLDRSKFINAVIQKLNEIPTTANNIGEIAEMIKKIAAETANLDLEKFKEDTERFANTAIAISQCEDEDALNGILLKTYENLDIQIPWEGDFDAFMGNKNNKLVFR